MATYQVPEKPLLQKLSENLFVQLALVILIGFVAVIMVTKNQKQSFWTRVQFLRGSSSTQISQTRDMNQFSNLKNAEINLVTNEEADVQTIEFQSATSEVKAKTLAGPVAKIYYLEVPQAVLNKWLEEGLLTRVETSYEVTIGYIPKLNQALEQYKNEIKVLKQESYTYSLNQLYTAKLERSVEPAIAPTTGRSLALAGTSTAAPETQNPGIVTYATLDDDRNDTLSGQLEVSINPQSSFPAQFEMTPDQSFFISGFDKSRNPADRNTASETVVILKIDK